jgi:tripartite-type tricarboxylate transporter receptor subunit TctC
MKLPHRRQFLHLTAGAAALPAVSRVARAQTYPTRPVRIIVGFAAGGPTDFHARLMGQWLSERLGQQFVVENRTGAGGTLGAEAVVRAPADGYTLHLTVIPDAINATLYDKLNFNIVRDLAPVGGIIRGPQILLLHPALAIKTLPEFIAHIQSSPGSLIASGGIGTPGHLVGELFKRAAGLEMVHVPYRGEAPALTDVISGHVQVMFSSLAPSFELIKTGKLRAIAVTTATRLPTLSDVPTVDETISGFEMSSWAGMSAPRGTPREIIDKLNSELNEGLASQVIMARYSDLGYTTFAVSPAQFGKFVGDETEKWGKVIRTANIKPE